MIQQKQKKGLILFSAFGLLVSALSLSLNLLIGQISYAWCDQNASHDDICLAQNWDSIPGDKDLKRSLTYEQFQKLADDCMSGNPSGLDFGSVDQGTCNNAVTSCLEKMVDVEKCKNKDVLADIAYNCDEGKTGNDLSCDRIRDENEKTFQDATSKADTQAKSKCSVDTSKSQADQQLQREACAKAVTDKCPAPDTDNVDWYDPNKTYDQYSYGDYQSCLDNAFKSAAKDKPECEARGGIWEENDTKDPNGPNTLSKGCYNQASDLTNPEACAAAGKGYQWKQTGGLDTSKPQDDAYGCVDPTKTDCTGHGGGQPDQNGVCPDGTKVDDGTAAPPDGSISKTTDHCGQARVNLLACGDDEGAAAFNNVLRIILQVLTVLIGIAAVGGLAYAAVTYARAEDNASVTGEAKTLIRNIVIGILLYGFLVAIASWLIPGLKLL